MNSFDHCQDMVDQFLFFWKLKDLIDLFSFDKDEHVYMENEICISFCCEIIARGLKM